jgi:hypothetical protein
MEKEELDIRKSGDQVGGYQVIGQSGFMPNDLISRFPSPRYPENPMALIYG